MNLVYSSIVRNKWSRLSKCKITAMDCNDNTGNTKRFLARFGYHGITADGMAVIMRHGRKVIAIWLIPPAEAA